MKLEQLTFNLAGKIRHEQLEGRDHLVVPAVMIVEGVLNGSKGPLYYPAEELSKSPAVWNHKPLVVYHPKGTACDPVVLNTRKVGVILNTKWDAPKLRTEAWIDVAAANRVDKRIIESLEANKPVEVSTGLFTRNEAVDPPATFNGKEYTAIARDYAPDHLAILPDMIGACSIEDGAGLLQLNNRDHKMDKIDLAAVMSKTGLCPPINNVRSYQEITTELYSLIQARYGYDLHIEGVFDGWFVYCREGKSYKLSYTVTDEKVSIGDDATEVYREVRYVAVNNGECLLSVTNNPSTGESDMSKAELIAKLIQNGGYEEADREILNNFAEDKLQKMVNAITPAPTQPDPTANANPPQQPPVLKPVETPRQVSLDEYVANAPPEIQEVLRNGVQAAAARKAQLVQTITNNKNNRFTADYLNTLSLDQLEGIAAIAQGDTQRPVANYLGAAVPPTQRVDNSQQAFEEEALPLPTLNFQN